VARAAALAGVEAAAVVTDPPLSGEGRQSGFRIRGKVEPPPGVLPPFADIAVVTPGYFQVMDIPVRSGRAFSERDDERSRLVAIVDQAIAQRFWPGKSPVGESIAVDEDESGVPRWREVVGVAGSVKPHGLEEEGRILVYLPLVQETESTMMLAVRTRGEPAGLVPALRREIWRIDREQAIGEARILDDLLARTLSPRRLHTLLLGVFAAAALALAALGIYGVMAQAVAQRTREIGIRMAVGASAADVLGLILKQGAILVLFGLALGAATAFAMSRLLSGLLYGVSATDPLTFAAVSFVLASVALLASYMPARRASRIDPITALRYE
jgi:putative ABC transport system permease protein